MRKQLSLLSVALLLAPGLAQAQNGFSVSDANNALAKFFQAALVGEKDIDAKNTFLRIDDKATNLTQDRFRLQARFAFKKSQWDKKNPTQADISLGAHIDESGKKPVVFMGGEAELRTDAFALLRMLIQEPLNDPPTKRDPKEAHELYKIFKDFSDKKIDTVEEFAAALNRIRTMVLTSNEVEAQDKEIVQRFVVDYSQTGDRMTLRYNRPKDWRKSAIKFGHGFDVLVSRGELTLTKQSIRASLEVGIEVDQQEIANFRKEKALFLNDINEYLTGGSNYQTFRGGKAQVEMMFQMGMSEFVKNVREMVVGK